MAVLYLIPSVLHDEGLHAIPSSIITSVKDCQVIFAENERTARRYLKKLDKNIVIDEYEWFALGKSEKEMLTVFRDKVKTGKNIAIISEAGCPGIADPGQRIVAEAQQMNVIIKPLAGPSSILLGLMASGMNGQRFQFVGYLPIQDPERGKAIRELEVESKKKDCTQIFIETPYRNEQLFDAIIKNCQPSTRLCIATDLTSPGEWIKTTTIKNWKNDKPGINKRPAIFLLYAK
jgi:16S rRNA (cytidine1402-2'-O)-methyltransferase